MINKSITYRNYDNEIVTDTFWFHLTRVEILDMEFDTKDGLEAEFARMVDETNRRKIFDFLKRVCLDAYGVRTSNVNFVKSPELRAAFANHPAFDELIISIMQSDDGGASFIKGVLPQPNADQDKPEIPAQHVETSDVAEKPQAQALMRVNRSDVDKMSAEELRELMSKPHYIMDDDFQ